MHLFVFTLLVTVIWLVSQLPVEAKVIGASVLPHGDFAFAPQLVHNKGGSLQLHEACTSIGEWIMRDMKPDLVFLSTPHGLELDNNFLIYKNANESGSADVGQDLHNSSFPGFLVNLSIRTNEAVADELTSFLNLKRSRNVSGLVGFADSLPLTISWGEILPIEYLRKAATTARLRALPDFILMGQPLRRYNHSVEMVSELLELGAALWDFFEHKVDTQLRVFLVISADLAHTHFFPACDPYGYCPCAEPFDQAVGRWAATMDREMLLRNATKQQALGALSCGYTGLVMLQGVFDAAIADGARWTSLMQANYHPTYYGMMAANFSRAN